MNLEAYFDAEVSAHQATLQAVAVSCRADFEKSLALWISTIRGGGKLLFCGNGGSAGDAQHLATELTVRFKKDRSPIAALALTTDTSSLTAIGNDFDFTQIFARQIDALGAPNDLLIAISTSGKSPNIIQALKMARHKKINAMGFSGGDGGEMPAYADPLLCVPSHVAAPIQEMHIMLGQMLCSALEQELGLV